MRQSFLFACHRGDWQNSAVSQQASGLLLLLGDRDNALDGQDNRQHHQQYKPLSFQLPELTLDQFKQSPHPLSPV